MAERIQDYYYSNFQHCRHTASRSVFQAHCYRICSLVSFPIHIATSLYGNRIIELQLLESSMQAEDASPFELMYPIIISLDARLRRERSSSDKRKIIDKFLDILDDLELEDKQLEEDMRNFIQVISKANLQPCHPGDSSLKPLKQILESKKEDMKQQIDRPLELCCDLYSAGIFDTLHVKKILAQKHSEKMKCLISDHVVSFLKSHRRCFCSTVLEILDENDYLSEVVSEIRTELATMGLSLNQNGQQHLLSDEDIHKLSNSMNLPPEQIADKSSNVPLEAKQTMLGKEQNMETMIEAQQPNPGSSSNHLSENLHVLLEKIRSILSSSFHSNLPEIQNALHLLPLDDEERRKIKNSSFEDIFCIVELTCTVTNQHSVYRIGSYLKSTKILQAIDDYEDETNLSQIPLFDSALEDALAETSFDHMLEIKLKIDQPKEIQLTLGDLKNFLEKSFQFLSKYLFLKEVQQGCLFVRCYTYKCLEGALQRFCKETIDILIEEHVVFLTIGDCTILSPDMDLQDLPAVTTDVISSDSAYTCKEYNLWKEMTQKAKIEFQELSAAIESSKLTLMHPVEQQEKGTKMDLQFDEVTMDLKEQLQELKKAFEEYVQSETKKVESPLKNTSMTMNLKEELQELKEQFKEYEIGSLESPMETSSFVQQDIQTEMFEKLRLENMQLKMNNSALLSPGIYGIKYIPSTEQPHTLSVKIKDQRVASNIKMVPSPLKEGKWITTVNHLNRPFHIDARSEHIVVTEYYGQCVSVFNKEGVYIRTFGSKGDGPGEFHCPSGIALTEDNHIIVVDKNNCRIQKFTIKGEFVEAVGSQGKGPLQFSVFSCGLSIHPRTGKIYVCDTDNHRIQVINSDFTFSHEFGSLGQHPGQFYRPYDVAFDDSLVYVVDQHNYRVQVFTLQGDYLSEFGGKEQFKSAEGIAVDTNEGVVYVSDSQWHKISLFRTGTGEFIRSIGGPGNRAEICTFNYPAGLAVDDKGTLYVCDRLNSRLQFL